MASTRSPEVPRGARARRSPIETLLEGHPGDRPLTPQDLLDPATAAGAGATAAGAAMRRRPVPAAPAPELPAVQDVALGILLLLGEQTQRAGILALLAGRTALVHWIRLVRTVSPQAATARVDAGIVALAERGRRSREDKSAALSGAVSAAMMTTATSDVARALTVAAVEQATDDVIAVVMPAMLAALREAETEAALDDMMAGLLVRQLPSAMEKALPTLLMRTATRPTQLVPFLGGVLPRV